MKEMIFACFAIAAFAGCQPTDIHIEDCRYVMTHIMASPSTFRLVRANAYTNAPGRKDVWVEFDAQNQHGATIRSLGLCSYAAFNDGYAEETEDVSLNGVRIGSDVLAVVRLRQGGEVVRELTRNLSQ